MCIALRQSVRREVLSEHSHWQVATRQFGFPKLVMGQRIAIDRLGFTSMYNEIGLPVPIQIQFAERDAAFGWFLKDPRGYRPAMPLHFAGKTAIYRDQFHIALPSFLAASRMRSETASGAENTGK